MYGQRAEALYQERSGTQVAGKAATVTVKSRFTTLRREHRKMLAVVRAVLNDMREAEAPMEALGPVAQILNDSTAGRLIICGPLCRGLAVALAAIEHSEHATGGPNFAHRTAGHTRVTRVAGLVLALRGGPQGARAGLDLTRIAAVPQRSSGRRSSSGGIGTQSSCMRWS